VARQQQRHELIANLGIVDLDEWLSEVGQVPQVRQNLSITRR
jgi:hypothetical protein